MQNKSRSHLERRILKVKAAGVDHCSAVELPFPDSSMDPEERPLAADSAAKIWSEGQAAPTKRAKSLRQPAEVGGRRDEDASRRTVS